MTTSSTFWDKIALRYERKAIANPTAYEKKLAITRKYLNPNSEVLELGCGTGSTALLHAPYVKRLVASDISPKMIEIARAKAKSQPHDNLEFRSTSVADLTVPDQSFDAVLGLSLLHLLEHRDSAIHKAYRLLVPGGVFITSTPCIDDHMKFFKFIGPIGRALGFFPLVRVFKKQELIDSIFDAGFEIDYEWQVDKSVVFIVAKKPTSTRKSE